MKVAFATILILVLWLIAATPYWKTSDRVFHTFWKGNFHCCYERTYEDKLHTTLIPPFFHASPYWHLLYTIKMHRLKQNCVCIFIARTYTKCLPLRSLCRLSINKQSYFIDNTLDEYTDNDKKSIYPGYNLIVQCYTYQRLNIIAKHVLIVINTPSKNVTYAIDCYVSYTRYNCSIRSKNSAKVLFLTTNSLEGPQLNLWNEIVVKVRKRNILVYKITYQCCFVLHSMEASPSYGITSKKLFENSTMVEVEIQNKKRSNNAQIVSSQKKVKGKEITIPRPSFWLGFHALNLLAQENNQPMEPSHSVSQLVRMGVSHEEALDWIMSEPAFPYVLQEEWPLKRMDGKEGNHYNLIQLPHELEVDEYGFALDYHVAIFFELGDLVLLKDDVMTMVIARLKHMHIEVGNIIGEPIAIMCYHGSKRWSGAVKIHLKDPQTDGSGLLQGLRPFILKLDEQHIRR